MSLVVMQWFQKVFLLDKVVDRHRPKKCSTVSSDFLQFELILVDVVEVFVESTVANNYVKDGAVAHLVLNAVFVELANNPEVTGSNEAMIELRCGCVCS